MSRRDPAVADLVADVDRRLFVTYASLGAARRRYVRGPSAVRGRACADVEAQLDELLDLRLALTSAAWSPGRTG